MSSHPGAGTAFSFTLPTDLPGDFGRFDKFARPVNSAFREGDASDLRSARDLWPAGSLATRGSIAETFGTATVPRVDKIVVSVDGAIAAEPQSLE